MCTTPRKLEAYEAALLEIAALGNSTQGRLIYARPVQIAETALERYRRPEDVGLLSVDLAAGETEGQ